MPRHLRRTLAGFACLAALAACGGRPKATGRAAAGSGPHQGGRVVVATADDVETFNEYQWASESFTFTVVDLLFPSLMTEQPDYQQHPPSFAPALASSWEFSADNRDLTFHLRPDARWSDGVPVTADDVRFTFSVQKNPELGGAGLEYKSFIQRVDVLDPHTVRFHFSKVYPYQLMDANDGHIIPAHAWGDVPASKWQTTDFEARLVTGGPFRVASHTPQQTLIVSRDPLYWGRPQPYLDSLVFRVIPDASAQVRQLIAGDVDLVPFVPPQEADRVRRDDRLELVEFPSRSWGFIGWNNRSPLFSDRRVRRALTEGINRRAAVDSVYHGFARLSNGPILSTMWAYNHDLSVPPYDPDDARALLAEAGWRDTDGDGILDHDGRPLAFDLLYPSTNAIRRDLAVLIQADLARIGVRVRPTPMEFAAFVARQESGNFQAVLGAWTEGTRIELASVWATAGKDQGSNNFIGYSDPEVDRLIEAARGESDHTHAKVLYDRIQELIVADQPVTFLYEADRLVGLSRHIRNADINAASVFFNVGEWYWEP
jgi:peptide/nickel transport system substrate-binding protein